MGPVDVKVICKDSAVELLEEEVELLALVPLKILDISKDWSRTWATYSVQRCELSPGDISSSSTIYLRRDHASLYG